MAPILSLPYTTGLCPDWDSWDASKPVNNAREAMQQADDWLGIPQVQLRPDTQGCQKPYSQWGEVSHPRSPRPGGQMASVFCL